VHELQAPTDMAMNIMELCKAYEQLKELVAEGYVRFLPMLCFE
jgi:2Fe-2S ferredoxin